MTSCFELDYPTPYIARAANKLEAAASYAGFLTDETTADESCRRRLNEAEALLRTAHKHVCTLAGFLDIYPAAIAVQSGIESYLREARDNADSAIDLAAKAAHDADGAGLHLMLKGLEAVILEGRGHIYRALWWASELRQAAPDTVPADWDRPDDWAEEA